MHGLSLLDLIQEDGIVLKKQGREYIALCPFHDERTPSLTVKVEVDRPFYHCFGCSAHGDAVAWLVHYRKMEMRDAVAMRDEAEGKKPQRRGRGSQQKPASTQQNQASDLAKAEFIERLPDNHEGRYVYLDAKGNVRFVVQRYVIEGKKTFGQYTRAAKKGVKGWLKALAMDDKRPLYRLAEILKAPEDRQIMVVEGEKCAEAVAANSNKALPVCWAAGTQSWRRTDWSPLHGRPVLLVADGDRQGHKCMKDIAAHLAPHCPEIMLVLPPLTDRDKKARDIADEIEAGTNIAKWLRDHGEIYDPDHIGEGCVEPSAPDPSEDGDDEWGTLIAAAKERPGVVFESETLSMLVALSHERYDEWVNLRARFKRECPDVPIRELDKAIRRVTGHSAGGQGRPLEFPQYEPWHESVNGAILLNELVKLINNYVVMPDGGPGAVAAWVLYAWTHEAFGVCPNLVITAPEREAGKTRLCDLLSWMVPRPLPVSDMSATAIFRAIEGNFPTLMIDEAQNFLSRRPDDPVRGILLASFTRRFAEVLRCVGELHEIQAFSTYSPKIMDGRNLVTKDDMLTSRSIVIPMTRTDKRLPDLPVTHDPVGHDLRSMCTRWRDDNKEALRRATPEVGSLNGV